MHSRLTPKPLENGYFCLLFCAHTCRRFNNIRVSSLPHNPKVAGSNPAPATNRFKKTQSLRRGRENRPRSILVNVRVLSVFLEPVTKPPARARRRTQLTFAPLLPS